MYRIIQDVYIPNISAYYPSALEEMRGIADGAQVPLQDIVLLNSRYDLARLNVPEKLANGIHADVSGDSSKLHDAANECTSAFFLQNVTATGDVINAQNWDMSARLWLNDAIIYLEIHPDPSEEKPSLFLVTEAGQLGRSGMNSLGLGVTANSLMSTEDYAPSAGEPVMPISLLRRMVLECAHMAEVCVAIHNFPRHVSNNLTVATAEGFGACFEITPSRTYKVYSNVDDGYLVHSNHFTHPGFLARPDVSDRYPGGSSWFRRQRLEQGIRPYKNGLLSVETLRKAMCDHLGFPEALCCHPDKSPDAGIRSLPGYPFRGSSATVASVAYNLSQRTVTVCKGPPCQGYFQTFALGGPKHLSQMSVTKAKVPQERGPEIP